MAVTEPLALTGRRQRRSVRQRLLGGGTAGNEQLTAVVAVILLLLFAALGLTILQIGPLIWLHLFLGVLLVGPVALKIASTGYRFTRYYTASREYRRKGPPHPLMRLLGPVVVLSTFGVFFSGLLLLIDGPKVNNLVRVAHKGTFIIWFGAVALHVLGHLAELPSALKAVSQERGARRPLPGSSGRTLAVLLSLAAGAVLVVLFLPDFHPWSVAYGSGGIFSHGH